MRWWTMKEFRDADPEGFDPHQGRLLGKLQEIGLFSSGRAHSTTS